MWRKSALWGFLIPFLLILGAWLLNKAENRFIWPALGLFVGFIMEIGFLLAERQKMRRVSDAFVLSFVIMFVSSLLLHIYHPGFHGFAAGMLFPIVITLLIYQICKKRIITWDDIKSSRLPE